jgi:hypothetical protein
VVIGIFGRVLLDNEVNPCLIICFMVVAHPKSKRNNHMFYGVCTSQVKKEYNNVHRLYYMVVTLFMVIAHPMSRRSTTIVSY